jgi:hypothetical protein
VIIGGEVGYYLGLLAHWLAGWLAGWLGAGWGLAGGLARTQLLCGARGRAILTKQTRRKSIPKKREYKLNTNLVHTCGTPYLNLSDPTHKYLMREPQLGISRSFASERFVILSPYTQNLLGAGGRAWIEHWHCASCFICILFSAVRPRKSDG